MDIDRIILNEKENDGQTIYLYFNDDIGMYTAYGPSAFFLCHVIDPVVSYSRNFNLPVALINKNQVLELRQSLKIEEHERQSYYRFLAKRVIGLSGYEKWKAGISQI